MFLPLQSIFLLLLASQCADSVAQRRHRSQSQSLPSHCPKSNKFGRPPPHECKGPMDPNLKPRTRLEKWFKKQMWQDFFPHANHGWGSNRYFPEFGAGATFDVFGRPKESLSAQAIAILQKRDVAAFFGHIVQETGENNMKLLNSTSSKLSRRSTADCFYRGGLYQFFEGGPKSKLFTRKKHIFHLSDGEICVEEGRYCRQSPELDFWYPCDQSMVNSTSDTTVYYRGCYFGRGPLQLSWNYNYGQFQDWLHKEGIEADMLSEPNSLLTRMDPPLAMLSALWFYMTPQPPKPSMHSIIIGDWKASEKNARYGYNGSVFGPTNLVINNECGGEDSATATTTTSLIGGPGENRRIKAYKWFCERLGVDPGDERTLSCKDMPEGFEAVAHKYSWQPDWSNMWKAEPCDCAPAPYPGAIPYYDPKDKWAKENERNRLRCVYGMYAQPDMYRLDEGNSPCLNHPYKLKLGRWGLEQ